MSFSLGGIKTKAMFEKEFLSIQLKKLYLNLDGSGTMVYQTNEKYVGGFKNDEYDGKGIYYYANGNIKYDGDFSNGLYESI